MNLQLAGLEIRKTRIGRLYGCAADAAGKQMRSQSFVAKLRVGSKIFRARPPLAVVQRHSVEGTARQKQTAAVAKRKMPYRSPQHDIRARQMTGHERSIQPDQRRRRDPLAR